LGGDERLEPHAGLVNPGECRVRREIEPIPLGIDHLWDQRDVGKAGRIAMAEEASAGIIREQPFKGLKSLGDPMVVPSCDRRGISSL